MSHNIALTQVRPSHHATAKLIIDAVDMDTVKDYYPSEPLPTNFIDLCQMIVKSAKGDVSHEFERASHDADAIEQWLRGLPSICSVPYTNYCIEQWLSDTGVIQAHHSASRRAKLVEQYWRYIARIITMYATKTSK